MGAQNLQLQRVVGVTFDNRAHHIRQLRNGDAVWLQIDHTNPFDPNAVVVLNSAGDQLGFIAAKNSARVRRHIEIHSLQMHGCGSRQFGPCPSSPSDQTG